MRVSWRCCLGVLLSGASLLLAQSPRMLVPRDAHKFRVEAEEVIVNKEAVRINRYGQQHWNYWTTDKNAEKKWSGSGIVIQSPAVREDRQRPEDGAPPLKIVIPLPDEGPWRIVLHGATRVIGFSLDGKEYRRIRGGAVLASGFRAEQFECWFDDMFAEKDPKRRGATYLDFFEITKEQ